MKKQRQTRLFTNTGAALLFSGIAFLSISALAPLQAVAQGSNGTPALVITNDPLPQNLQSKVYSSPAQVRPTYPEQLSGRSYFDSSETKVGKKVTELRDELFILQGTVSELSEQLAIYEQQGRDLSANYYADIATINTQLQSGTTPGNPRLVQRLVDARTSLETLGGNIANLNDIAVEITQAASVAAYLLESAQATYSLAGAIEEDHVRLAQLEDAINNTVVVIDRMLDNVNDDITRTMAYLSTERSNLRTLSVAVNSGDLFGRSLVNRPFSRAAQSGITPDGMPSPAGYSQLPQQAYSQGYGQPQAYGQQAYGFTQASPRPLVKIRFDKPNVSYEQPLYLAVNEALERFPNARFELVAVHPTKGNAAQVAIESTRARRNAEKVLRSLTQMGLSADQVELSYAPSAESATNEVHLYIR